MGFYQVQGLSHIFFAREPIAPHVDVDDAFSTPSPQILPHILWSNEPNLMILHGQSTISKVDASILKQPQNRMVQLKPKSINILSLSLDQGPSHSSTKPRARHPALSSASAKCLAVTGTCHGKIYRVSHRETDIPSTEFLPQCIEPPFFVSFIPFFLLLVRSAVFVGWSRLQYRWILNPHELHLWALPISI